MERYTLLKVSPPDIRNKLLSRFPFIEDDAASVSLRFPRSLLDDVKSYLLWLRELKRVQDRHRRFSKGMSKVMYDLSFFRGEFDAEVNAYRVDGIIPRSLFEQARLDGLVFAVRFKSVLLEEHPDGVLFWYIREDVSLT